MHKLHDRNEYMIAELHGCTVQWQWRGILEIAAVVVSAMVVRVVGGGGGGRVAFQRSLSMTYAEHFSSSFYHC